MKKYAIAKSVKELHNNYKIIAREYYANKKQTLKAHIKQLLMLFWYAIRTKDIGAIYDRKLCELYFDEIELYYLINDFSKRDLQIENSYLKKVKLQRYSVTVPIFLSVFASLIYGLVFVEYTGKFWTLFENMNEELHEQHLGWKDLIEFLVDYEPIQFILYLLLLVVTAIMLVWMIKQIVNIISFFISGPNSNRAIAEQYREDYLEDLIPCYKYYHLTKVLNNYAKKLLDGMDAFMEKDITMESFVEKVEKKFLDIENREVDDEMIRKWGKKLICKAIIYRSFVCVEKNEKEKKDIFDKLRNSELKDMGTAIQR